jgi:TRAP-type mannitol/chloroaromatic compound transport system permease large subunit
MDIAVLLVTMFFCFAISVPIAYSLALAAIAGAFWIGIPLEAVMLKISDGVSKVAMLTIPFFVLAGAIMAEGGMARRLVAFAAYCTVLALMSGPFGTSLSMRRSIIHVVSNGTPALVT